MYRVGQKTAPPLFHCNNSVYPQSICQIFDTYNYIVGNLQPGDVPPNMANTLQTKNLVTIWPIFSRLLPLIVNMDKSLF